MSATILRRCSFTGCRQYIPASSKFCAQHKRQRNQTYGRRHRNARLPVFEEAGWRCHYCGKPVTHSDDIAHLERTSELAPHDAPLALRVPAHRACHNANAPHLS